ncbi:uncharacterized protein DS421_13g432250 [Arachis hypogaea]|nr:uncharacterized protein DS421_13g432250 [Arachis hypogaea]
MKLPPSQLRALVSLSLLSRAERRQRTAPHPHLVTLSSSAPVVRHSLDVSSSLPQRHSWSLNSSLPQSVTVSP